MKCTGAALEIRRWMQAVQVGQAYLLTLKQGWIVSPWWFTVLLACRQQYRVS